MKHVVLVGATDGIGLALARTFTERWWRVAVVGRDGAKLASVVDGLHGEYPGATVVGQVLDVSRREDVLPAMEAALAALGQMDLLVYCAGVMENDHEGRRRMLDVNVLGAIDVLEWGADYFVMAGGGHLAAIGSVAGDRGRAGQPAYAGSKAALHEYLEGLRHRLHPSGVKVSTIKPGWVRTRMLGDVPGFPPAIAASRAAEIIARKLERGAEEFYVPGFWRWISLALRHTPRFLFKRAAPP